MAGSESFWVGFQKRASEDGDPYLDMFHKEDKTTKDPNFGVLKGVKPGMADDGVKLDLGMDAVDAAVGYPSMFDNASSVPPGLEGRG